MDLIQEAIEYIESREDGDGFSYRQVSKIFGVDRTTLSRRHKEQEVVSHIDRATRDGLPPTGSILKNFGSAVAQQEVSDSWVKRFRRRYPDKLITKWDTGIDRERHVADSKYKYELYFNLLHSKIVEHGIDERNTYNMDEKGFFVGIANRRKRIFSKAVWEAGERT
ncbi:hypothetical protein AA0118_g6522 [Alternaria tenuissima]|nr:hypothetical protein AA0118_g6522 [Alternaria tenuissima]